MPLSRENDSAAERIAISSIAATLAFWAYTQTLLPGVDLGDTGGFQAAVLWPEVSARQAYPLYYGLARPFVSMVGAGNPARALNLLSSVWAAAAVGLLTFVCACVTRRLVPAAQASSSSSPKAPRRRAMDTSSIHGPAGPLEASAARASSLAMQRRPPPCRPRS